MTDESTADLGTLCAGLADELGETTSSTQGDVTSYERGGALFARVAGDILEVRLPADIAEAALRTPDTSALAEPSWIRFVPKASERHVTDRVSAWFQTAWRHAADTWPGAGQQDAPGRARGVGAS